MTGNYPEHVDIPLNPVREEWPLVEWWDKEKWLAIKSSGAKSKNGIPINSVFLEDVRGMPVSKGIRDGILKDARGFWTDQKHDNHPPCNYNNTGVAMTEDFRKLLEGKYPILRLCEGHWKASQVWINNFSSWSQKNSPVIEITDSDEGSPVHPKRERSDEEKEGKASKKHKAKDINTPPFHPPRPKAKRTQVGKARVSDVFFFIN